MKNGIQWELMFEYLRGRTTKEDEEKLNEWIHSDIKNKRTFDQIKKIWNTPRKNLPKADVEKAWINIKERIDIENSSQNFPSDKILEFDSNPKRNPFWWHVVSTKLLKIAAVVLVLFISSYFLFIRHAAMNEIIVGNSQKTEITLEDGTLITLDAGSIFRYPKNFESDMREVFLNGEGYFEVAHDNNKPFIIHANDARIKVLGTKFNVRAWRDDKKVVVAVAEGKVSLRSQNESDPDKKVVITKGQVSVMRENEAPSEAKNANVDDYLSWLDREDYFRDVPLQEVFNQLERWYDVDIQLSDESYASNQVTIFIKKKPIEEILDVIALMNNLQYKQNGKKIIFTPNEMDKSKNKKELK
jgi:transmembrane sensor